MKNQEIKFKDKLDSYSVFIGSNTLNILPHQIKKLCPKTKIIALIIAPNLLLKFGKKKRLSIFAGTGAALQMQFILLTF